MTDEAKDITGRKRSFKKSRPYPPYSLDEALRFISVIEKLGGRNVSEMVLLKELGVKEPRTKSFWGKAASAKQFALLTIDGHNYTLTEKAKLILRPKDEDSKRTALTESFLSPELYKELYEKFVGQQLPSVETLANILFHDHGLNVNVSFDAAKAFIESAKYVNFLGPDNILRGVQKESEEVKPSPESKRAEHTIGTVTATIKLSEGTASVIVPESGITKKDFERLKKLIEAYIVENEAED
ncbi:MAG: hypothetical protein M0Z64_11560 [Nitrospiraceae bacterium]|nr:hypothetical protein [Nitrospiraceae bacterium]